MVNQPGMLADVSCMLLCAKAPASADGTRHYHQADMAACKILICKKRGIPILKILIFRFVETGMSTDWWTHPGWTWYFGEEMGASMETPVPSEGESCRRWRIAAGWPPERAGSASRHIFTAPKSHIALELRQQLNQESPATPC